MKLFLKTFLVLVAAIALTVVVLRLSVVIDLFPGERRPNPPGPLLSVQLSEAIHAYETGGPRELRSTLERMHRASGYRGLLLDRRGIDLVTGQRRLDIVADLRGRRPRLTRGEEATYLARRSADGQYIYAIALPRPQWYRFLLQPEFQLLLFGMLLALTWFFARHLTSPVRNLQRAVEQFGKGDLSTRLRSQRRDELGQLARSFDQMADRIQTLLHAERRLLQDISHELRSPLARLGLSVELARSGDDLDRHLDRIQREADRLNTLVGELLLVTRVEGDPSKLRKETIDAAALTADIVESAKVEAQSRNVEIRFSSDPLTVDGDRELLHRALENVVRNAIRFAPEGTQVDVELKQSGNNARFTVRDRGPGVPEESLARIFDAFYRVESDRNRTTGGTGLGLSIAKRALELHGGTADARNSHPGLTVALELPAGPSPAH
jgi:two-component system sensor histidine kinase CpxA